MAPRIQFPLRVHPRVHEWAKSVVARGDAPSINEVYNRGLWAAMVTDELEREAETIDPDPYGIDELRRRLGGQP